MALAPTAQFTVAADGLSLTCCGGDRGGYFYLLSPSNAVVQETKGGIVISPNTCKSTWVSMYSMPENGVYTLINAVWDNTTQKETTQATARINVTASTFTGLPTSPGTPTVPIGPPAPQPPVTPPAPVTPPTTTDSINQWVTSNPILAIGIAGAAYLVADRYLFNKPTKYTS